MAHVPLPAPEDLDPASRAALQAAEGRWGYTPDIVRALALRPGLLHAEDAWSRELMHRGTLPRALKEAVATTVSVVNGCNYCATSHAHAQRLAGAPAGLAQACARLRFDHLPAAERAALEFARKAAADMASVGRADVDALRAHYTPAQVVELAAVVGSFMMYNTFVTVLGLELEEPHRGKELLAPSPLAPSLLAPSPPAPEPRAPGARVPGARGDAARDARQGPAP